MAGCLVAGAVTAIFLVLPVVLIIQQLLFADFTPPPRPETSVVVDGFSGLDGAAARVPRAFNLSLSVDNPRGSTFDVCVGGEAAVLYDGVPLATGPRRVAACRPAALGAGPYTRRAGASVSLRSWPRSWLPRSATRAT